MSHSQVKEYILKMTICLGFERIFGIASVYLAEYFAALPPSRYCAENAPIFYGAVNSEGTKTKLKQKKIRDHRKQVKINLKRNGARFLLTYYG